MRRMAAVTGTALVGLLGAGCGSSSSSSSNSHATAAAAKTASAAQFANLLPADIRSSGVLTYASEFDYPPYDYTSSSGAYTGGEIAILNAVAPLLGVKFKDTNLAFASLVPAMGEGKFNLAGNQVEVSAARRKVVSYVTYGTVGQGIVVPKGNPSGVNVNNMCGHSLATETGTITVTELQAASKACTTAGKKPITIDIYSTSPASVLAVENGHANGFVGSTTSSVGVAAQSKGKLVALPGVIAGTSSGVGFIFNPKDVQLAKAFQAAMTKLLQDGELAKINQQWVLATSVGVQYLPATGS